MNIFPDIFDVVKMSKYNPGKELKFLIGLHDKKCKAGVQSTYQSVF